MDRLHLGCRLGVSSAGERRCAGHGRVTGGVNPLRGLSEATASRRQLHEMKTGAWPTICIFAARPCGMEARDQPWYRTPVNPRAGWLGWASVPRNTKPDFRPRQASNEGGDHGKRLTLTPGGLHRSAASGGGNVLEGNDGHVKSVQKSDHLPAPGVEELAPPRTADTSRIHV